MRVVDVELTTPARRHACDVCYEIFICHLCAIGWVHPMHEPHSQTRRLSYLCTPCAIRTGRLFRITSRGRLYNYLTGRLVQRNRSERCLWLKEAPNADPLS